MADHDDMRHRAAQQASYGNYWAGKCVGLLDRIKKLETVVDRIPADRLNPWHTVTVRATGWHMAHPIECDLAECPFDGLAQAEWSEPPTAEGVWQWHNFDDEPWDWIEQKEEADDQ